MTKPSHVRARAASSASPTLAGGSCDAQAHPDAPSLLAWIDRRRGWIFIVMLCLYALAFNGQWRITPDSVKHAVVAHNLLTGAGYTTVDGRTPPLHPGLPTLMAMSFYFFGPGAFWPAVAAMTLMGLASLALVYRLFLLHADRPTAVAIAALVGVNAEFFRHASYLLTDLPFVLGLLLFLVGFEGEAKRRATQRGVCTHWAAMLGGVALMAAFRPVVLTFLTALALLTLWRSVWGPRRIYHITLAAGCGATALLLRAVHPGLTALHARSGDEVYALDHLRHLGQTLHDAFFIRLPMFLCDAVNNVTLSLSLSHSGMVLAAVMILLGVGLCRRQALWGLLVLTFSVQIVAFVMVPRYLLPMVPLLAAAWWFTALGLRRRLSGKGAQWAFAAMLALWIVPNLVAVTRFIYEQRRLPFYEHYLKDGRYARAQELVDTVVTQVGPDDLILQGVRGAEALEYFAHRPTLPLRVAHLDWKTRVAQMQHAERFFAVTPDRAELGAFFGRTAMRLSQVLARTRAADAYGQLWQLQRVTLPQIGEAEFRAMYDRLLMHEPDDQAMTRYWPRLAGRELFAPQMAAELVNSDDFVQFIAPVLRMYDGYLNAWPSYEQLRASSRALYDGQLTLGQIAAELARTPAFIDRHGEVLHAGDEQFVAWLGAQPHAQGKLPRIKKGWLQRLASGEVQRPDLLAECIAQPPFRSDSWHRTRLSLLSLSLVGHPPSEAQMQRWTDEVRRGDRLMDIAGELILSDDFVLGWRWAPR